MFEFSGRKTILRKTVLEMCSNAVFSGLYFAVFGLNAEICGVDLLIQSKYGKTQTTFFLYRPSFGALFTQ